MNTLRLFKLLTISLFLSVLFACSGGTGSDTGSDSQSSDSGRVSLLITDGPTTEFDQINITLESISFLSDDGTDGDDTTEVIVFKESKIVNLLALQNYSDLLTTTTIPAGTYNKIRLHVSQVELVKLDANGDVAETHIAKLPANGKIDLNPKGSFELLGGGHLIIELDVDANKSILVIEKGNGGYNFRPVIFVNILGEKEIKLVILDGKVLDKTETGFKLCEVEILVADESCFSVAITDNTVVQNDEIVVVSKNDLINGDIVTVLGKASSANVAALHVVIADDSKEEQDLALFNGDATSIVGSDNVFSMITDDSNDVVLPEVSLDVLLADGSRIFDKFGTQIGSENIVAGSDVDVFGLAIPDLNTVSNVKAAFVIHDDADDNEHLIGTIFAIDGANMEIEVTAVEPFVGDACAAVASADMFFLASDGVTIISNEIDITGLQVGMKVYVYGEDTGAECFSADVVLASDS